MNAASIRKLAKTDMKAARNMLADLALELLAQEPPVMHHYCDIASTLRVALGIRAEERFAAAFFDSQMRYLGFRVYDGGSKTRTTLYMRSLARDALHLDATMLVLAHNHPSGNPQESFMDRELTRRVKDCLVCLEVELLDHLILLPNGQYSSFKDRGML